MSDNHILIAGHVLEFVVEPSDTVVEAGQSAVLDCVVKAAHHQASVLIQWLDQDRSKLTYLTDMYRSVFFLNILLLKARSITLRLRKSIIKSSQLS